MSNHSHASAASFDAARPAVMNRLGKKQTDKLTRADGDTWQEYIAVSEKAQTTSSNGSTRGGALSFFGKKKKKKNGSSSNSTSTNTNERSSSKLVLRSYYQNQRTGKKVWDEPPSGASRIVPATEEMRRMAELQLDELYVPTSPSANNEDMANNSSKKNKGGGIFRRGNNTNCTNGGTKGEKTSSGTSANNSRRIRYKPNSNLLTMGNASTPGKGGYSPRSGGEMLNDRQLREAIERSMIETYGGSPKRTSTASNVEQEDEILRRVLEESRLEALSLANKTRSYDSNTEDFDFNDRKPPARKQPPTNTGMHNSYSRASVPSTITQSRQSDRRRQPQQRESWSSTPSSLSSAPRRSHGGGSNNPSRRSMGSKNNLQDDIGFV